MSASLEATTARGSTFGPTTCSAPTGKRLSVAPATQPEGPGAMSMHRSLSLPACFALADTLTHASFADISTHLHRRVSTASNAFIRHKIKQGPPVVTTIDLYASRRASGGVGDEESASTDDRFDGLDRGQGSGRLRRLWGPVGG